MKKKRIVKLEPQTVELFAEVLSKLRPPPPLTVSQWADRYRVLSAESSAEPGRWHTEKAPYQRAIMDAIGDPHVRSVVVMSAAQIGKTDAFILNPLGYYMDYLPTRQEKEAAAKKQQEHEQLPDRVAEMEDALCEQDAANEKRLTDIETALCELDAALNKE